MLKCVCVCVVVMYGFTEGDGEESHPEIRYEAMGDSDHRVGRDLRYEGCVCASIYTYIYIYIPCGPGSKKKRLTV